MTPARITEEFNEILQDCNEMNPEYIQGTQEWLKLRKTKVTATDASIIMGVSPWKTRWQLYQEKISTTQPRPATPSMQRGIDLEPKAREAFILTTGIYVSPKVIVKDWQMASVDGISDDGKYLVEIKCPGQVDHSMAVAGKVPAHYYPQLQHQMHVCDVDRMFYFSFDGVDGALVEIIKDNNYIEKMLEEEWKFYQCLINKMPPEPSESDYFEMDDPIWKECALRWREVSSMMKELEKEEENLRNQLIFLSGASNSKGAGISLCQMNRKGNVDYSKIPELKNVNLDLYRKPSTKMWRITSE